ncbi:MAG: hypothetical protein HZA90_14350 [Verrucomicrobia bacterium]|nr:hypothetical protein [Verrucomicrobiota bacterium]
MTSPDPTPSSQPPRRRLRIVRGLLFLAVALASLIALFYAVENWRGQRALQQCKRELEAKGEKLAWDDWLPKPVPDESNFFKAPGMEALFVRIEPKAATRDKLPDWPQGYSKDIPFAMADLKQLPLQSSAPDKKSLASLRGWFQEHDTVFQQIEAAAQRPQSQLKRDPDEPFGGQTVHFVTLRKIAQLLSSRTKTQLLSGQPAEAARSLALLGRLVEAGRDDHPPFLVQSMISVAIAGLAVTTFQEGLAERLWPEAQLIACQDQLQRLEVLGAVATSLRAERAGAGYMLENWPQARLAKVFVTEKPKRLSAGTLLFRLLPRGWLLQNEVVLFQPGQEFLEALDEPGQRVNPRRVDQTTLAMNEKFRRRSPYNVIAAMAVPNLGKALRTAAKTQSIVRQAAIACALERCRLATGAYPDSLEALVPRFIAKLPADVVPGQSFQYRRNADGSFLLYSFGWNEKDDGAVEAKNPDGSRQLESGDWVWNAKDR